MAEYRDTYNFCLICYLMVNGSSIHYIKKKNTKMLLKYNYKNNVTLYNKLHTLYKIETQKYKYRRMRRKKKNALYIFSFDIREPLNIYLLSCI